MSMKSYAMFTEQGDTEVGKIVDLVIDEVRDGCLHPSDAYDSAVASLEMLRLVPGFEEAMDTAVRDEVYDHLMEVLD